MWLGITSIFVSLFSIAYTRSAFRRIAKHPNTPHHLIFKLLFVGVVLILAGVILSFIVVSRLFGWMFS